MTDDFTRQRISLLRFLMIFGIVMLHAPPYVPIAEVAETPFDQLKALFQHAIFRTTVPVLTFVSGFLLFQSGLDRHPAKLARKKFRTIVVPFLFFNIGLLAIALGLHHGAGITLSDDMIPHDRKGWLDAAFGLTGEPINYPLNFLRDLVALMIVAPLLGWILRHAPWIGLLAVVLVFRFNLDGRFVLRDVMWPVFYVGGLAAVRGWNMRALDRYAPACLAIFLALCACVVYFRIANTNYLRMAAPFLIWPAAAMLVPTALGRWLAGMSKYSFFVFVAHAPVLLATWMVYKKVADVVPYPLYWIGAPVVTTASLVMVYRLAMRYLPGLFSLAIGATRPARAVRLPAVPVLADAD